MKVVWQNSGDYLDFSPMSDVAEYYINSLGSNNDFSIVKDETEFDISKIDDLTRSLEKINDFLKKLKMEPINIVGPLHEFNTINRIHEKWVKLHLHKPAISTLAEKLGFKQDLDGINELCHKIERMYFFIYKNYNEQVWQIDNPFDTDVLDISKVNIVIEYGNLGRSTFNKWCVYDDNIDDVDTNNYDKLGGKLEFTLARPYTINLPIEYLNYCKEKNIKPAGGWMPLGNFTADMSKVREVFLKNMANNLFLSL